MKKTIFIALVFAVMLCITTTVSAAYLDIYWTDENPMPPTDPTPKDPGDASAGWTWPNPPWSHTGAVTDNTTIGAGKFRLFGLENQWMGEDWIKTVVLEFDYVGGDPVVSDRNFGYHPLNHTGGTGIVKDETNQNGHYKLVYEIRPQPDWEYFAVLNTDQANAMTITNFSLTSSCIPEPVTICLLGLGGLLLRTKRI